MKPTPKRTTRKLPNRSRLLNSLLTAILTIVANPLLWKQPPASAATGAYCRLSPEAIAQKENLRQAALGGNPQAEKEYKDLLIQQAREVGNCRLRTWPRTQAIWLRLYPCDARPGELNRLMDDIVNKGYNEVYIEVFYDGQVLLPANNNPTVWPSVIRNAGPYNDVDLLAQGLAAARDRGLKAYAWLFTMNFGYTYSQRSDRQNALARNGAGQRTIDVVPDNKDLQDQLGESHAFHTFVDPYSPEARQDYATLVNEAVKRRPEGVLFDYVRYLRGTGEASVASNVKDLWIYGESSQQVLLQRAKNDKGRELIRRFLDKGYITSNDVSEVNRRYSNQDSPLWPTVYSPTTTASAEPTSVSRGSLLEQLWQLSVAHAAQGVLDFLSLAVKPVQRRGMSAGAVFFAGGNNIIRDKGFDSRLQPWDQFPANIEWHPMAYAVCGENDPSCIISKVERVLQMAPAGTNIKPALAGVWGSPITNRPSLEVQMQALRRAAPQIDAVSHYSYGWQEIEATRSRKSCRL